MEEKEINHSELGDFTFDDIEEVNVTVKIKGKNYAVVPKKGQIREAKINRHTALYLMFDEHIVKLPAINEKKSFAEILKESMANTDMIFMHETTE